jgi:hypothetical protein
MTTVQAAGRLKLAGAYTISAAKFRPGPLSALEGNGASRHRVTWQMPQAIDLW